jgi:hypothetical protein
MTRQRVTADVVWLARIGHYDCEGRSVQSWSPVQEFDTEGDARRYLVAEGLSEKTEWNVTRWRDDYGYRVGTLDRILRDAPASQPQGGE